MQDFPHLTPMERLTLETLVSLTAELGRAPSMATIGRRLKLERSGVQRHMQALKTKGMIQGPEWIGDWKLTPLGKKCHRVIHQEP